MGLDLKLLPFEADNGFIAYSHTILNCIRRKDLFEEIAIIEENTGHDVPENFHSYVSRGKEYEEPHYGRTVDTPYGNNLKYVYVGLLLILIDHESVNDNPWNKSVWAYLSNLPEDTKVALYWC